jgi:phospholipid/cholesterol/gamma-HCH transport system substrate-binding protein
MRTDAGCAEPGTNLRGSEKAPPGNAAAANRPPVATYDERTGKLTWADQDTSPKIAYDGGAAQLYGADSWKSMLLQPSQADDQE